MCIGVGVGGLEIEAVVAAGELSSGSSERVGCCRHWVPAGK